MFTGFTDKTSEFIWELSFNNERAWFVDHKDEFEEVLNRPFKALAHETMELMEARFPDRKLLLHVSRIYRDARRLHGRGPYKDHLWFSIKHDDGLLEGPMFWFEIGAADYSFGMGFYSAKADDMAAFRRIIDANPARFERLFTEMEAYPEFKLWGEEYKKSKGEYPEPISRWYNRKRISMQCERDFGGVILSPDLPRFLADEFEKLMPLYDFFIEFYTADKT